VHQKPENCLKSRSDLLKNKLIGNPQNLVDPQRDPIVEDNASVQRVQQFDGLFGMLIDTGTDEPLFLSCGEMLGLLTILQQQQSWIREHDRYNEQWSHSETTCMTYVFLRKKENREVTMIISLKYQTDCGWYGTYVHPLRYFYGPPVEGGQDVQEFATERWEEYGTRMELR
jgi:hypothetical protein